MTAEQGTAGPLIPPGGWPGRSRRAGHAGRGQRGRGGGPGRRGGHAGRTCRASVGLPRLPAPGRLARGGGRRAPPLVPRRALLGPPHSRLGIGPAATADRGPRARGPRREPYRPDLHRRPQRRFPFRVAVPVRMGGKADQRGRWATASAWWTPGWWRRSAAPRRPTSRNPPNGTPARRGWPPNSAWWPLTCASSSASADSPGRPSGRCSAGAASRCPRPRPAFGHGAEVRLASPQAAARRAAHRLLSPEPAEHVHRPGHPGHAGRHLHPRPHLRRTGRRRPAGRFIVHA